MGESHPAASKVVLEFCPTDLPDLTPAQQLTLIKIVGVRYHPGTEIVKMSCESFPEQAQNKRMLLRQLRSIIATVMDPTADHFEDIPVDTRHYRPKIRPVFPPHWALTDERRQSLEKQREAKALLEHQKASQGLLVDGEAKIQEVMARPVLVPIQMAAPVRQGNRKTGRRS